uniref:elongation factor 1-gamma-like n=1 Tax=Styela clava TaxID=7725 RepID=UPI00193A7780|nr:elongation factor 1-gamma-like [Styela clava]
MSGTLYTFPDSFRAHKILIAAQYSGKTVNVYPNFVAGETDKSAEFLKKFPFGKVPAFECGDVKLFEPNGIAHYVGNEQTRGGDREAEVLQWIGLADNVILPAACTWVYPTKGILQFNKQNTEKAKSDIKSALTALNGFLATRTFLVGERVTQADISLACTLCMLYETVLDPAFRKPFGNVNRWFVTLINQPQFKSVIGQVTMCEKMAEFDMKKYNEIHGKAEKAKGKKAGGAGDSKSPKQKSKQPDKVDEPPPKPVKVDPWADLPPTTYSMDDWKKIYANNQNSDVYMKYFWENFDKEKYSIWRGNYKYNDDFRMEFLASNYAQGVTQRLSKLEKHAFAIFVVYGKEVDGAKKFKLDAVWFWRGQDLVFKRNIDWQTDYESFDWEKLDSEKEGTKELVKTVWSCETLDGWSCCDSKKF